MPRLKPKSDPVPYTRAGVARLRKLAAFLRQIPNEMFRYASLIEVWDPIAKCGTVCCALGWCPRVFPKGPLRWNPTSYGGIAGNYFSQAMSFFGLDKNEVSALFYGSWDRPEVCERVGLPHDTSTSFTGESTRKEVADNIEQMARYAERVLNRRNRKKKARAR